MSEYIKRPREEMNEKLKNGKETELGDGEKGLWRGSGMVDEKWCESGRAGRVGGRNKTDQGP